MSSLHCLSCKQVFSEPLIAGAGYIKMNIWTLTFLFIYLTEIKSHLLFIQTAYNSEEALQSFSVIIGQLQVAVSSFDG